MDLELVCKILCESCRLLWAQTVSRFRARFVWKGQAFVQVVRTRPTFINNTEVSSTADTVTSIGCPGIQAYTSANTEPGATLPKMQKDGLIEYKKNRILLKDWDLRNGMNLNRDWFFKQNRLWSEIEYSAIIHSYRASVINTDNKMITLACIGRIIWINQIIKRTVNTTENNL